MRLRGEVTAEDIAAGEPREASKCAVARALSRAAGKPWCCARLGAWTPKGDGRTDNDAEFPRAVADFIVDFDHGRPVQPFAFDLDVPDEAVSR